jgi:membrane-bound metal-dependent hydrolase YbcI (DUF457 family)
MKRVLVHSLARIVLLVFTVFLALFLQVLFQHSKYDLALNCCFATLALTYHIMSYMYISYIQKITLFYGLQTNEYSSLSIINCFSIKYGPGSCILAETAPYAS